MAVGRMVSIILDRAHVNFMITLQIGFVYNELGTVLKTLKVSEKRKIYCFKLFVFSPKLCYNFSQCDLKFFFIGQPW